MEFRMAEYFALRDLGCVRTNQEDYYLVNPEIGLFIVADGMGGAAAGEHASSLAAETVSEQIKAAKRRDAQLLQAAIETANSRVIEAARQDPSLRGMGTTLVVALKTDYGFLIGSVGDSRAYLLEAGRLLPITTDQSWVEEIGRPLGMDEHTLRTHPLRHALTMAVGSAAPVRVKHYSICPQPGSTLMLSSDGLHGVIDAATIETILGSVPPGEPLEKKCHRLIQAAREAGGPDNITVVLVRADD